MAANQEAFRLAIGRGNSAAWDEDWSQAAEQYRQALEIVPDDAQALVNLGLALFELRNFDDALACYERVMQLLPEDPLPLEKIAQIYENTGKLPQSAQFSIKAADMFLNMKDAEKAIENWTRVVRLFPENLPAHSRLALVHERLGRRPQAITEYLAVAALQQHEGDIEEAQRSVQRAIELNPKSKESAQALEMLQANKMLPKPVRQRGTTGPLQLDESHESDEDLEDTAKIEKESLDPISEANQKALAELASALFETPKDPTEEASLTSGLKSLARGVTDSLMAPGPDRTKLMLHLGQAIELQTRGQEAQAAEELKRAIDAGFDQPAAHYNFGILLSIAGRNKAAQRSLQRAINHPDFALASRLMIATYMREQGKFKSAVIQFLEALKMADAEVVPAAHRTELLQFYDPIIQSMSQEKDEEVLEELCNTIYDMLMRNNWRAHLLDARQQLPPIEGGMPPVPLAEILTHSEGSQLVEAMTNINLLARDGHFKSAMEEAFIILDEAPTYLPLHIQMGELLLRQRESQAAITKFSTVAEAYSARGEANRATELYQRIVSLSPMDFTARTRLIEQLMARGEVNEALGEYVKQGESYYRLAEMDMARNTYERALRLAQQSNLESDWNVKILHNMADIDVQKLEWRQGLRVFEQLRTLDPDDRKARKNLVELGVRMGNESQAEVELDSYISHLVGNARDAEALEFLEELVEENPEYTFARIRLAGAYQQAARVPDAVEQWDKVGEALLETGDRTGAIEAVQTIIQLNPPNVSRYETFLEKLQA
ncbi:MAG: tetratricopeptide repeat protein [Anaerolineae bacterium]|nr:tetratricopeptide repeat protein [Anaerolineae bacterium]